MTTLKELLEAGGDLGSKGVEKIVKEYEENGFKDTDPISQTIVWAYDSAASSTNTAEEFVDEIYSNLSHAIDQLLKARKQLY